MFEILGKSFETEKEFLDYVVDNEQLILNAKKSEIKEADGFGSIGIVQRDFNTEKTQTNENATEVAVKIVINTTNILDSHKDVHIPGLWKKSLKESGSRVLHLQEHVRKFSHVIAKGDDLKAYTETVSWKNLGFNFEGKTEALTFDSLVKRSQNKEMFEEYLKENVTEHSVGMQYVKLVTCINNEDYPVQKENWDKYAPMVVNKDALEKTKVFWAILEAKAIEGSAVLMGSNSFTPTRQTTPKAEEIKDPQTEGILKFLNN